MNQLVPLDALKASASPIAATAAMSGATTIEGDTARQDWQDLVTPGHVIQARITHRRYRYFFGAVALGLAGVFTTFAGPGFLSLPVPAAVYRALLADPNTYVDLGNGDRTSYRLAWVAELPADRGVTLADWKAFVAAVRSDLREHGLDAHAWTATAALPTKPKITRPAKAFGTENRGRLATGIVTVPDGVGPVDTVDLFAFVDGRLTVATVSRYGCDFVGAETPDCSRTETSGRGFIEHMDAFRPDAATNKGGN